MANLSGVQPSHVNVSVFAPFSASNLTRPTCPANEVYLNVIAFVEIAVFAEFRLMTNDRINQMKDFGYEYRMDRH